MPAVPLVLSHWNASIPVCVPPDTAKDLQNYHIMGVRFLYDCFQKEQNGAILNHEDGMNFAIQVSAFFNALNTFITPESPVLIVCSDDSINAWHYHLTNHGKFDVTLLSVKNHEEILHGDVHRVILATVDSAKLLKQIKETDFFAVVVDQLDKVATKTIIKQLKSQFNIGLTNRNFLKEPDQKLFWSMLNWSNSGVVGKFAEFCIEDNTHLQNLRCPYGAWWQRLTWKFCDTFKPPSDEERKQYKNALRNWSRSYNSSSDDDSKSKNQRNRKRKATVKAPPEDDVKIKQEDAVQNPLEESPIKTRATKNILKTSNKSISLDPTKAPKISPETTFESQPNQNDSQNTTGSQDTIIYDLKNSLPDDVDDNPILSSIMGGSSGSKTMSYDEFDFGVEKEHSFKSDEGGDADILTSIIKSQSTQEINGNASSSSNLQLQNSDLGSTSSKNDILSMLYGN